MLLPARFSALRRVLHQQQPRWAYLGLLLLLLVQLFCLASVQEVRAEGELALLAGNRLEAASTLCSAEAGAMAL